MAHPIVALALSLTLAAGAKTPDAGQASHSLEFTDSGSSFGGGGFTATFDEDDSGARVTVKGSSASETFHLDKAAWKALNDQLDRAGIWTVPANVHLQMKDGVEVSFHIRRGDKSREGKAYGPGPEYARIEAAIISAVGAERITRLSPSTY